MKWFVSALIWNTKLWMRRIWSFSDAPSSQPAWRHRFF